MKTGNGKEAMNPSNPNSIFKLPSQPVLSNTNTSAHSHVGGMERACVLSRSVHDLGLESTRLPLYSVPGIL